MKKFLKGTWNFITTFLTTIVIIIAVALFVVNFTGGYLYCIESGSMSPLYPKNSLVVVYPAEFEDIETGDVISYVLNEEGTIVTHRVVAIDEDNQSFTTQGDANSTADTNAVAYVNVVGTVRFSLPGVGRVVLFIQENKTAAIIIAVAILVVSFLFDLFQKIFFGKKKEVLEG